MTKLRTEIKRITEICRENHSVNGNPAWTLWFDDHTSARTSSDASCGYEIGNQGRREGCLVRVHYTRAGRIAYLSDVER